MKLENQRRCTLLAGVGHFMCLGLMYSWSKFAGQIRVELGFDHAGITLAYSLCMAMFTLGILSDGLLSRRLSSRSCALLGICVSAGGYVLTSLVPPGWAFLIYGTYGLCVGFGIGLVYNVWLTTVMQWFPDRGGLASGLLLLGMGLSGVTTTPLMALLSRALGWRVCFRVIGLVLLAAGLAACPPGRQSTWSIPERWQRSSMPSPARPSSAPTWAASRPGSARTLPCCAACLYIRIRR